MIEEKSLLKTEGIVLKSFNYKENERICTLYTEDAGLISLIMKGIGPKKSELLTLSTPFSRAEFVYIKTKSDLFRYYDGSILDNHMLLRLNLDHLKAAAELTNSICLSQLPLKPDPLIYALLRSFLKQIVHFKDPSSLVSSFYLKLLKHEGVLALDKNAFFQEVEKEICLKLILETQFSELQKIYVSVELKRKIEHLFKELLAV